MARSGRNILDEAGVEGVKIFVSGDLDEYGIKELLGEGAPIDSFGVGTQLGTSGDAPFLGGVYKLVEDEAGPKMKLSAGKATLPGRKQVYRLSARGRYERDLIALEQESVPRARPLLETVMRDGERRMAREPLQRMKDRCAEALSHLPEEVCALDRQVAFPVERSAGLDGLLAEMRAEEN